MPMLLAAFWSNKMFVFAMIHNNGLLNHEIIIEDPNEYKYEVVEVQEKSCCTVFWEILKAKDAVRDLLHVWHKVHGWIEGKDWIHAFLYFLLCLFTINSILTYLEQSEVM